MASQVDAVLLIVLGLLLAGPADPSRVHQRRVSVPPTPARPRSFRGCFQLAGPVGVGLWGWLLCFLEFLLLCRASQSHYLWDSEWVLFSLESRLTHLYSERGLLGLVLLHF